MTELKDKMAFGLTLIEKDAFEEIAKYISIKKQSEKPFYNPNEDRFIFSNGDSLSGFEYKKIKDSEKYLLRNFIIKMLYIKYPEILKIETHAEGLKSMRIVDRLVKYAEDYFNLRLT